MPPWTLQIESPWVRPTTRGGLRGVLRSRRQLARSCQAEPLSELAYASDVRVRSAAFDGADQLLPDTGTSRDLGLGKSVARSDHAADVSKSDEEAVGVLRRGAAA
jgi:hypothetical protein